jgi:hypothetical protein
MSDDIILRSLVIYWHTGLCTTVQSTGVPGTGILEYSSTPVLRSICYPTWYGTKTGYYR